MAELEKILIVDDSEDDAKLMVHALRRAGHDLKSERVDSPEAMLAALKRESWDLVISDYSMPRFNGIAALKLLKAQNLDLPFILVSGAVGEDVAVQAMKAGAQDYILKHNLARLPPAVERELREAEVRRERIRAEARYRSLFERVPVGVFSTTPDGKVLEANSAFVQMLGFTNLEELKRASLEAWWVEPKEFARRNALLVREGVIRDFESQLRRPDGSVFWCAENARAEYDRQRTAVARFEGVMVDITDRKRVQQELAQARDVALETARLKSEFLATMSHEIRTPLNGIVGMCELLRDSELTSGQAECADLIGNSADSLLTIINDILDFSKLTAGKLVFEEIDFDLIATVEAAVNLLGERAAQKGIELVVAIDRETPGSVRGDPNRLRQVLTNLLGNAVKFTERGEVVMSVSPIRACRNEIVLEFKITDTGIGIDSQALRGLFQPFHQADGSTTRKYGGTGLGLAISAQLVERMDGTIGVTSAPGAGSSFFFNATFLRSAVNLDKFAKEKLLSGLRVLVVDDNDTNRQVIQRQIANWGINSASASSGPEALAALRERDPDARFNVAILDLAMPGMDGMMLAQLIKTDPMLVDTRLLLMSSIGGRGEAGGTSAPIEAWLTKPVKQSQLYDSLAELIASDLAVVDNPGQATPSAGGLGDKRQPFRVLVAEDNIVNQSVIAHQLHKLGYEANIVANGLEALQALASAEYPLVLMDCMMPEIDGFEATAELRRREAGTDKHTVIVAMTAKAMEGDREKCLAAGMDDYLGKPVQLEELAAILDRWLIGSGHSRSDDQK
jgi:two-component system, sensor histidine kinase and response regulator